LLLLLLLLRRPRAVLLPLPPPPHTAAAAAAAAAASAAGSLGVLLPQLLTMKGWAAGTGVVIEVPAALLNAGIGSLGTFSLNAPAAFDAPETSASAAAAAAARGAGDGISCCCVGKPSMLLRTLPLLLPAGLLKYAGMASTTVSMRFMLSIMLGCSSLQVHNKHAACCFTQTYSSHHHHQHHQQQRNYSTRHDSMSLAAKHACRHSTESYARTLTAWTHIQGCRAAQPQWQQHQHHQPLPLLLLLLPGPLPPHAAAAAAAVSYAQPAAQLQVLLQVPLPLQTSSQLCWVSRKHPPCCCCACHRCCRRRCCCCCVLL
jgi:hypothetical protein